MATLKGKIILNIINTVAGLLFPLVTFPYVSRVLMPEGIGLVQFYQSIINYIVLLSALGIPLYAVREIARLRDDETKRNKASFEILLLHALLSTIGYIIVFILIISVTKIHSDWPLFLLLSLSIFFNVIGVSWFYQAVEDFKYITIRSLIVRFLSAVALFIFVKDRSDLYAYAIILVFGQVGNYIFNFIRLRKFSFFKKIELSNLSLKPHLIAALKIFILNVAISLYVNINPVMLGFMSDDAYVGYYTSVTRILTAANGLTLALGGVILPRLSNYYAKGNYLEFKILKKKVLNIICILCIPLSFGLIIISPILIPVFSGSAYSLAIPTLEISALTVLFSALNYIISIQVLYTQGQENIVIKSTIIGGIVNILLNFILIPNLNQNGTAISGLCAELSVLICCYVLGNKYIQYNLFNKNNLQALISTIGACLICSILYKLQLKDYILLPLIIISVAVLYLSFLMILKNKLVLEYKNELRQRIKLLNS